MSHYRLADHKLFHVDGRDYLYLAGDGTIFEINPIARELLTDFAGLPVPDPKGLYAGKNGDNEDKKAFVEELLERRVFIPEIRSSAGKSSSEYRPMPLQTLVLHLTDACTLRCRYCYQDQTGRKTEDKKFMTAATACKSVDFILNHCGFLEEIQLVFFGGEPLLNFDLIKAVTSYARQRATEKGKSVSFAITTNGTLLTDRVIAFLHENEIGITISMDGVESIHDRYRRFPDGSPSYARILPKVQKLLEASHRKPVVARVTVAGTPDGVSETMAHLLEVGFAEVGFAPVTTENGAYQLSRRQMAQLLEQFQNLAEQFEDTALSGSFFGFTNIIDLLVVLHEGEVKRHPCGAGLGLFSVNSDGDLYLCQRLVDQPGARMGNIETGFNEETIGKFRSRAAIDQKKPCLTCWARAACAGGCYHEALLREGSLTEPNLHYCDWIKQWVATGLQIYGKLASACPDYLDKLSLLRGHAPLIKKMI